MIDGLPPAGEADLDALESALDGWLRAFAEENEIVTGLDRGEAGQRRWYVRMRGEEKDVTAVWLTLRQRALHVESYVMPAPEENHAAFFEHLLARNRKTRMLWFCVGDEDAVYMVGQVPLAMVDEAMLDRVLGSVYTYVEQFFRPAMRIGYASRFK